MQGGLILNTEILEPVLNEEKKPVWLAVNRRKSSSTTTANSSIKEIAEKNTPLEEIKEFKLVPEGKWICNKCGNILISAPKPPLECYELQGGCGRVATFNPITDIITDSIDSLWKLPKWIDIPKEDIKIIDVYKQLNEITTKTLIFPEEILYKIYDLSIISGYFIDEWESIGWLLFVGLHDSGKSRALDFISEVGYRMVHAGSGVTFPAVVRASHDYTAGVLIDQCEKKLVETSESGREMLGFILPSYRRRSKYVVADKENPRRVIAYRNFGFKAFGTERGVNTALTSRCIPFQMERDYPEIARLTQIQDELDTIQTQLLNYKYKFEPPNDLGINCKLQGRIREIFEPIIATGKHIGVDVSDVFKFALDMEREKEEELQGTIEWEILNAIKSSEENEKLFDAPEEIEFKDVCSKLNWDYDRKSAQKLGYIFNKKLLLKTKRKAHGTVLLLNDPKNERKLKYLFKRYKV